MILAELLYRATLAIFCYWHSCSAQSVTSLGKFSVANPAFATLYEHANVTSPLDRYDLLISTFSAIPFSTDSVQYVNGIGNYVKNINDVKTKTLTTHTTWPNEVYGVPENVFGKKMVVIPDGFILPFKTQGGVRFMDVSQDPPTGPYVITDDSTGEWFYHRVRWRDMDGDGDFDAVTCRAREPIIGDKASELLWLENPGGDVTVKWKPHILGQGPDIFFEYIRLNSTSGPLDCIVVSQFFTQKLAIYWTTDPQGHWTVGLKRVKSRDIDVSIGDVFNVGVYDLNNDGKLELLVNNNGNNGSVFAYEIPQDFRTGQFIRHTLSTGFRPLHEGKGKGAPGVASPVVTSPKTKPIILLSGDDNGNAFILTPKSQDPGNWQYASTILLASGSDTVGQIAYGDVDGDGHIEVFVPAYSTSQVYVYRLE